MSLINVIVFSKNRACQLDLLIRSLKKHWKVSADFKILYQYTSDEFHKGYDKLCGEHTFGVMEPEKDFRKDIIRMLRSDCKYSAFLTDDDIIIRDFEEDPIFAKFKNRAAEKNDILCFSLRLGENITYCYPYNKNERVPLMARFRNTWRWRGKGGYWGFPMSGDGHIFLTEDIVPLVESKDFRNPAEWEYALENDPIRKPLMMCYDHPRLINLALHSVQNVFKNRNCNIGPEYLNNRYLDDEIIALEPIEELAATAKSCHVEVNPIFQKRQII